VKMTVNQMTALARVAKHVTVFDNIQNDVFWGDEEEAKVELAENAGSLHVEAFDMHNEVHSSFHWEIQHYFHENICPEVQLAVFDEDSDTVFRCELNGCDIDEAIEMVFAAKTN